MYAALSSEQDSMQVLFNNIDIMLMLCYYYTRSLPTQKSKKANKQQTMKKAPKLLSSGPVASKAEKLKSNGFTITVTYLDEPAETIFVRASSHTTALV
jgi:hypothetical protein